MGQLTIDNYWGDQRWFISPHPLKYVGNGLCAVPLRCNYNLCKQTGTTHRHVIPRERMRVEESSRVASFILWWSILQRGGFLHSADAAVGMTMLVRFYGFAYCFYSISRCPAALIRLALGRASFPQGKLLYRAFGWCHSTTRVVFETWHGDESSPLHCVIPFIRTGYTRKAPGTAHRPFPTVSLKGGLFQPAILKTCAFSPFGNM